MEKNFKMSNRVRIMNIEFNLIMKLWLFARKNKNHKYPCIKQQINVLYMDIFCYC